MDYITNCSIVKVKNGFKIETGFVCYAEDGDSDICVIFFENGQYDVRWEDSYDCILIKESDLSEEDLKWIKNAKYNFYYYDTKDYIHRPLTYILTTFQMMQLISGECSPKEFTTCKVYK